MIQEIIDTTLITFELMSEPIDHTKDLKIFAHAYKISFEWTSKYINGDPVREHQVYFISNTTPLKKIIKDVIYQLEEIQNEPLPEYVDDWTIEDFYKQIED